MSLKHIQENYARLLVAFKEAGVKLTESQKKDIDGFIIALESQMEATKKATIKATRKVVEDKLSKEYRAVVESIIAHQQKHAELAAKIQSKAIKINESRKLAKSVDNYLDIVLERAMPKKRIVDYDRLNKLESVFESLKDTLLVNDASVEAKRKELTESFEADRKALDSKIASLQKRLNESISNERKLVAAAEKAKAKDLLAKKTKDLPLFEAQQIRRRLANSTCEEIEKNFKALLESVREEMKAACNEEEKTLEEEINGIIAKESESETNDTDETKKCPTSKKDATSVEESEDNDSEEDENVDESDKNEKDEEDVELNESEKIPSYLMQRWMSKISSVNPIG